MEPEDTCANDESRQQAKEGVQWVNRVEEWVRFASAAVQQRGKGSRT